jgi:hypothetical protein
MKKFILLLTLFIIGCGGHAATNEADSRIKVVEDYNYYKERGSAVRVVVVKDTKTDKHYLIWADKTAIELGQGE